MARPPAPSSWLIPWTTMLLWVGMFIAFVLVLTQLRRALDREKEMARVDSLTLYAAKRGGKNRLKLERA